MCMFVKGNTLACLCVLAYVRVCVCAYVRAACVRARACVYFLSVFLVIFVFGSIFY